MAHALDFVPQLSRPAVTQRPARQSHRLLFGLPVCDFSWEQALDHVRALMGARGQMSVLSFVDPGKARLARLDGHYAGLLSGQVLLPAGRGLGLAARVLTGSPFQAEFAASTFVPSLLTFAAEPLRVGVIGEAEIARETLAARLRLHAPWHAFEALSIEEAARAGGQAPGQPAFDLLIVTGDGKAEAIAVDRLLGPSHASLAILAGSMAEFTDATAAEASSASVLSPLALPLDICREWVRKRLRP